MSKAEELTIGSENQKAYRDALADTERKLAGIMDDTATQQVTFTKAEHALVFQGMLAINNAMNRQASDNELDEKDWCLFVSLCNSILTKLDKITDK